MTGIQLRTKERLDSKTKLHMSLFYPMTIWLIMKVKVPLKPVGTIVWQKQEGSGFASGAKFADMIAGQRQHLQTCFRDLNKQPEYSSSR